MIEKRRKDTLPVNSYENLDQLRDATLMCEKCGLAAGRTKVVFGVGNPRAKVMLIGEGPGQNEDLQGEPFVGRAGQLLDKMLLAAGFSRGDNVYIANMVKCRPPDNRDPTPEEVAQCLGWLREQTRLIRPKFIVCLGRIAAQQIIDPKFKVTQQHGQFTERNGVWLMGTFHPAALLRNPLNKPEAFDDLCKLRDRVASL